MAEPIRKPTAPAPRLPLAHRPRPRRTLHRSLLVQEEPEASPAPGPARALQPVPAPPPQAEPAEGAFAPAPRRAVAAKRVRTALLIALGVHAATLAAGTRPSPSDLLLAIAVLLSGGILLALGTLWGRSPDR